jgi:hypothetical protein
MPVISMAELFTNTAKVSMNFSTGEGAHHRARRSLEEIPEEYQIDIQMLD